MWGIMRRFSSEGESQMGPYEHAGRPYHQPSDDIDDPLAAPARRQQHQHHNHLHHPHQQHPTQHHRYPSPFQPPPLDPIVLHGYKDGTPASSRTLTLAVAEEIRTMVPERLRISEDWNLVYSLEQNGASLNTLYQKCRNYAGIRVGFVLVIRDQEGGTFGAYLSEYPHPAPSYFGNGECFLWRASTLTSLPLPPSADTTHMTRSTTIAPSSSSSIPSSSSPSPSHPPSSSKPSSPQAQVPPSPASASASASLEPSLGIRFKGFPYSGLNDFYINCETGFLSVGSGGGHYGLWLDDSLDVGHSSRCETFGNEPLSDAGHKFRVVDLELWVIGAS